MLFLGFIRISILEKRHGELFDDIDDVNISGRVISEIKEEEYYNFCIVKIDKWNDNTSFKGTKVFFKFRNNQNIDYGDVIIAKGGFSKNRSFKNKGVFQYSDYLKIKGIYGSVEISKIEITDNKKDIGYLGYRVRSFINNKIDLCFDGDENGLIKGILLGNTDDMSDDMIEKFQTSGISHILAVSGAHVACIIIGLEFFCNFFIKSINNKKLVIILFLSFFVFVVGFTPSIIRAVIMTDFILISKLIHRKSNIYLNLFFSSFLILLYNPYFLFNSSFLLSFFATFGIVYMFRKYRFKSKNKILDYFVNIVLVSVYANLFIIPVMIMFYNQISIIFIFYNLIISPIMIVIETLGLLFIVTPDFISKIISIIVSLLLKIIIFSTNFSSSIPFSKVWIITPNIFEICLYYFSIFYFTVKKGRWRYRFIAVLLVIAVIINNFSYVYFKPLTISFIDVGQGDSCLIQTKTNKTILIDGGGLENYDIGKKVLLPYLLNKRIWKIDYVIVSHFDYDHVGGLLTVLDEIRVDNVIISKQIEASTNFEDFKDIVSNKKTNIIVVQKGDKIKIEKDLYLDFLWPDSSNLVSENGLNNNSIVCKLQFKSFSMLFTGDIEEKAEKQFLYEYKNNLEILDSDVLKVAHHGSKSSSIQRFVETVKPSVSLIGVGENNKFGHPNYEVIERLKSVRFGYI